MLVDSWQLLVWGQGLIRGSSCARRTMLEVVKAADVVPVEQGGKVLALPVGNLQVQSKWSLHLLGIMQ